MKQVQIIVQAQVNLLDEITEVKILVGNAPKELVVTLFKFICPKLGIKLAEEKRIVPPTLVLG